VIGIDEIAIRKGHTYRIVVSDLSGGLIGAGDAVGAGAGGTAFHVGYHDQWGVSMEWLCDCPVCDLQPPVGRFSLK